MQQQCNLAVDIGASSGRVIAGYLRNGKLQLEEVHRFDNKLIELNNYFCWDIDRIYHEILTGIKSAVDKGYQPISLGIDTWAVDFVLLDENDNRLTDAVSYRDPRTDGMMEEVFSQISKERLYLETGIQFQKFNTIYQLQALKNSNPDLIEKSTSFLMIPDYLNFLLTGKKVNEYTNATTTQLVNAFTKKWDIDLIEKLGFNSNMFMDIQPPESVIGNLRPELQEELGVDFNIILPATHDTGSAVVAVPELEDTLYISSGTWSLIGVENHFPICITKALDYNFTNEGGADYRFRFLKNIMGLWMIQEVKRNFNDEYDFADFAAMAKEESFSSIVDVDDNRFLKPENMIKEIKAYCEESNQAIPQSPSEVAKCVFNSLAVSYQQAISQIEEIYEIEFPTIHIIGGGSKNEMLNQLIADTTGKIVIAGLSEATAIGNLIVQMMATDQIDDIEQARQLIRASFDLNTYTKVTMEG
ncbi:rhamnulokinase [Oceanobacillus kimchii]|uniref:Rhamnulokinase n=1 Tax=Oceanobacillus kimchii TaxID=746691 RepID=A0ABQ5TDL5_9BACI|nr:rhamnulokinase [Oceanobacillus kimchii]GLO64824.1 rhamnulokinase [Oceanobacillus kimchii]